MGFDIEGAKKAGYSDGEIADYLSQDKGFDIAGARQAGYADGDILKHLTMLPSTQSVAVNALNKGIAAIPDALLNAPSNVLNLGKAAVGTIATAAGRPDLAPSVTPAPNLVRGLTDKLGLTSPNWEPQTQGQRVLDAGLQGVAPGMLGAPSAVKTMANAVIGALSNATGQTVTEKTGDPNLGLAASIVGPAAVNAGAQYGQRKVAEAAVREAQKSPGTQALNEVRQAGYVVPPSQIKPTITNRLIEGVAGKAATAQEASIRNQATTDALTRQALNVPEDFPLSEPNLKNLAEQRAGPYREVAALPQVASDNPLAGQFNVSKIAIDPAKTLENLKQARFDANMSWKEYRRSGEVAAFNRAQQQSALATTLEQNLETAAASAGRPDLVASLRSARTDIAKIHDVMSALNETRGETSAIDYAKALEKGKPLTGGLKTAATMGSSFPKAVQRPENVGSPGVNNLASMLSAAGGGGMGAILGGPQGAVLGGGLGAVAIPAASILARKLILSSPYQYLMANPNHGTGPLPSALAAIPVEQRGPALLMRSLLQSGALAR